MPGGAYNIWFVSTEEMNKVRQGFRYALSVPNIWLGYVLSDLLVAINGPCVS